MVQPVIFLEKNFRVGKSRCRGCMTLTVDSIFGYGGYIALTHCRSNYER